MSDKKNTYSSLQDSVRSTSFSHKPDLRKKNQEPGNLFTGHHMIKDASLYVKKHISKQPPVQRFFSFMPTLLTRVSPFHFKSRRKYEEWPLVRLDSGDVNSWGRMWVVGELLVIFDETILFGILALMTKYKNDAFEFSMNEICEISNINPTTAQFNSIWTSIQRLAGTRIDLILSSGKGKKKKLLKEMTGSILSFSDMDRESGKVRVVINPYFLEMYAESMVTNIDLKFRAELKGDIAKALYRFYQGQYEQKVSVSLIKLSHAVNLDILQDRGKMKTKIRKGMQELDLKGYLESFNITRDDMVHITKNKQMDLNINDQILGPANMSGLNVPE